MKYNIPAIIFAGGKSSRMGTDKALLPFSNYPTLSEFQYRKLQQYFQEVYLSSKTDKFPFTCQVIKDKLQESSPLVALLSVFETLKSDVIFVLSVDAPLVDEFIIKKLMEAYADEPHSYAIIAESPNGLQPLCGIYKRSLVPFIKENMTKDNHRMKSLLTAPYTKIVYFQKDEPFTNLNTQEEYKKLS